MSSKTVAVPSDSTASTRDNANGFSTSGDSRVFLEDYAEAIKSLAEQQPMATAFLTTPVAPPRHKSTDPDNDPVWPQKAAARALKFALDEVADGRLVPSHYTFEHHRAASLGLGKGPEISYVFDDKRMAALFFVPVDASTGRPARDEFRGLFYPTRFCQGPMDNCHGGSSFTFTDCVATVLTGLYLSGSGADKGKLPYLSTKSHELTYKDVSFHRLYISKIVSLTFVLFTGSSDWYYFGFPLAYHWNFQRRLGDGHEYQHDHFRPDRPEGTGTEIRGGRPHCHSNSI